MERVAQEGTLTNRKVLEIQSDDRVILTLVSSEIFILAIAGGEKYVSKLEADGLHHIRAIVEPDATIWIETNTKTEASYRIDYVWELASHAQDALGMTEEDWMYIQIGFLTIIVVALLYVLLSALAGI